MLRRPFLPLCLALSALVALPAASSAATFPTVKKIAPKKLGIGDTMTITGKGFRKGKNKNTVVFKRDGGRAIFVKAPKATATKITVKVPSKLLPFLIQKAGVPQFTRFRVRILSRRFGKAFTAKKVSPLIGPTALSAGTPDDCDADGKLNAVDSDDDNDLIADTTEATLGTDACKRDSDGDGMSDGWEYLSALDRNGKAVPAPVAKPYPNPLFDKDGAVDHDGDGLTNAMEYAAWATLGGNAMPLSYSGGNPASAGRAAPPADIAYMDRDRNGFLSDFERDADGDGISNMDEGGATKDVARLTVGGQPADDTNFYDYGLFTDAYLKLLAEHKKQAEPLCAGVNQVPFYCTGDLDNDPIETQKVDTLDWLAGDTDGDGVRDGQDDSDHDGLSNIDEYKREIGAAFKDRRQGQLDACFPNTDAGFCLLGSVDVDRDGIPNRDDGDDDGDMLSDALENQLGLDPLRADTDNDKISDGFEYESALDLNSRAVPFPGERPFPNALDGADGDYDYDQDSLTLREEYKAWLYSGRPVPLNYSDGTSYTGGRVPVPSADVDINGNGFWSDDEKDVDADGLSNWDETHGRMTQLWWKLTYNGKPDPLLFESPYPGPEYLEPSFVDPDSDGDGVKDGADDQDHDGYDNLFEVKRPADWRVKYVSTVHPGTNPEARVQPFNPCKPIYSDACHKYPPFNYYKDDEDWESPYGPGLVLLP